MPTTRKIAFGEFVIEDSTSQHARIDNIRSELKHDVYGRQFFEITFNIYYVNPLPNDNGQGMVLGYDAYDSKGFLIDAAQVFMAPLRVGQKGRGVIQLEADKVHVSFFGKYRIVV